MTRRLVYLGVVAALLVVGDVAARGFVESTVDARAQQEAPPGSRVSASVGQFPFLPGLVFGGEVSKAGVHVENVPAGALVFAEVDVDLRGVHLDRGRLVKERKARITAIDHGKVTATVTAEALSTALKGVPVRMASGKVLLEVGGQSVEVTPQIGDGGRLTLSGNLGRQFALVIPSIPYVPCVSAVEVQEGRMQLSCELDDIPPALLDAVQDATGN